MTLGEELWKRFIPKYLESLGAPLVAIGGYGSLRDLLDGLAQYPGGWLADRYGRRTSLLCFITPATRRYARPPRGPRRRAGRARGPGRLGTGPGLGGPGEPPAVSRERGCASAGAPPPRVFGPRHP